eukprot:54384-Hanusia_phi.AAC.1
MTQADDRRGPPARPGGPGGPPGTVRRSLTVTTVRSTRSHISSFESFRSLPKPVQYCTVPGTIRLPAIGSGRRARAAAAPAAGPGHPAMMIG